MRRGCGPAAHWRYDSSLPTRTEWKHPPVWTGGPSWGSMKSRGFSGQGQVTEFRSRTFAKEPVEYMGCGAPEPYEMRLSQSFQEGSPVGVSNTVPSGDNVVPISWTSQHTVTAIVRSIKRSSSLRKRPSYSGSPIIR